MDNLIRNAFEVSISNDLTGVIISNSTDKAKAAKIKIRKVLLKEKPYYQVTEYIDNKVFHSNYDKEELLDQLPCWFEGLFRQAELTDKKGRTVILISKKGTVTVNTRPAGPSGGKEITKGSSGAAKASDTALPHNKEKNYILRENTPLPFLIDLGVMTKDGAVVKAKFDKFRQINRFLEYIEDVLVYLPEDRELTILDFGCGKSYLTFAMYYYLKILKNYRITIIGLDLKKDVIENCNRLSVNYGYDKLHFQAGDIASYEGSNAVDMVVTLHACDTATDHALYKAVTWGAQVILSVPCCQHELNQQIQCSTLKPVLKYGIVKERMAALITDALRAELLESRGYRVQLLEFIDMEHTPKNILIRAVKRSHAAQEAGKAKEELMDCMNFLNLSPCLLKLFEEEK